MSTLSVDTIQGKTTAGTVAMPSGSIVQVAQREVGNTGFSTQTNQTSIDITNFYVDITPKFSDSIIVWETTLTYNINDESCYGMFRVVDSNNSDAVIHSGTRCGHVGYYQPDHQAYYDTPIRAVDANCGTTSTMRLQLQVWLDNNADGAETFKINWSSGDMRTITATEIKA